MPPINENATIVHKEQLTPSTWRVTFQSPRIAPMAQPGQFVMVRITDGNDPLLRRPFSIHQRSSATTIQLLIRVIGRGTELLRESPIGSTVDILGPLGNGFQLAGYTKFCLVAGGIGVAPMHFAAASIRQRGAEAMVLVGARTRDEVVGITEFHDMGLPVSIATDDGSAGSHGSVLDLIAPHLPDPESLAWTILACGPHGMLKALAHLSARNGWHSQLSLETFMACGMGACLGCALPANREEGGYLHVCKDGPVFRPEEIRW